MFLYKSSVIDIKFPFSFLTIFKIYFFFFNMMPEFKRETLPYFKYINIHQLSVHLSQSNISNNY
jgi:hypothetical protein